MTQTVTGKNFLRYCIGEKLNLILRHDSERIYSACSELALIH